MVDKIIYFISIMLLTSCAKDWLNEKPDKRLAVPETLNDLQGLLDDVQVLNFNTISLGEIASDDHFITDALFNRTTKEIRTDAYIWSKTVPHIANNVNSDWYIEYRKVLYCNIILNGLSQLGDVDSDLNRYNNIKGQALFFRAFVFFQLAQVYAPPYIFGSANQDNGIVLRLSDDINIPSRRSTVDETYAQIINDLKMACDLLPEKPSTLSRPSKQAAYALLARVYLSMDDFDEALQYSNRSLSISSDLLDYNLLTSSNYIGLYNIEVLHHTSLKGFSFITSGCLVENELIDLYDFSDLRRTIFFTQSSSGTFSFRGNYNNGTSPLFSGLTTAETLLIRAECLVRLGKMEDALLDLNRLLKNRYHKDSFVPVVLVDAEDVLMRILAERRKELVLRGIRWMDLRRLNKSIQAGITISRTVNGQTYLLEPNSYKYTFPIPDNVVHETGIEQNSGWVK